MTTIVRDNGRRIARPNTVTQNITNQIGASGAAASALAASRTAGQTTLTVGDTAVTGKRYGIIDVGVVGSAELVEFSGDTGGTWTVSGALANNHAQGAGVLFLDDTDVLRAEWFGLGTATTNSDRRTALQATLTASNGRTVELPTGAYDIGLSGAIALTVVANQRIIGRNTTLRVPAATDFQSFIYSTAADNLYIEGVTFDMRGSTLTAAPSGTNYRVVVYVTADNAQITNCTFTGLINVNTIYVAGDNLNVSDCTFELTDAATHFDHSTVYYGGDNCTVENCTFKAGSIMGNGAMTAIETHGSNQTTVGNRIWGYHAGINVTGVIATTNSIGGTCANNTIIQCTRGIILWSYIYGAVTTGDGIRGFTVTGNAIHLAAAASRNSTRIGIAIEANSSLPVSGLTVVANTITGDIDTAAATGGVSWIGIGFWSNAGVALRDSVIAHNVIQNWPGAAILISVAGIHNVQIASNTITNAGSMTGTLNDAYRVGIFAWSTGDTSLLVLSDNTIIDNQATATMVYGMSVSTVNAGGNVQLLDNTVLATGADTSAYLGPIYIGDADTLPYIRQRWNRNAAPTLLCAAGSELFDTVSLRRYVNHSGTTAWTAYAYGTAAPVTGTWAVGDTVINTAPGLHVTRGWVCITAGTPGTWRNLDLVSGGSILGNVSVTGALAMNDNAIVRPYLQDYGEIVQIKGSLGGGTINIDLTLGNTVTGTVDTSTTTFTFSNPSAAGALCSLTLILTNGGSQTVNWPASVKWPGGSPPALTASGVDILTFVTVDAGTTWRGNLAGAAYS